MQEIWKDIEGYEGLYQVSNFGRIKSLPKYRGRKEIIKKQTVKKGYYQIALSKNSIKKWFIVHRIIARAFIENPYNLPQINHKDENKLNNNVDNLEWCTAKYNNCYGTRLKRVSESNRLRKSVLKFDLNGNFLEEYNSVTETARKNKISSVSCISQCCNKKVKQVKGYVYKFKE